MSTLACALTLHREGRLDEAVAAFEAVIARDPGNFEGAYYLSMALAAQSRFADALGPARRAAQLLPGDWRGHAQVGALLVADGRPADALGHLRLAVSLDPARPEAVNNLGAALRSLGDRDGALEQFRRAVALRPDYPDGVKNLANSLIAAGHCEEAIVLLEGAMKSMLSAELYGELGKACWKTGRIEHALIYLRASLELDPDYDNAREHLGHLLVESGRIDEARSVFARGVASEPERPDYYLFLAEVDAGALTPQHAERLEQLVRAAQSPRERSNAKFALARYFESRGEADAAFRYLAEGNREMRAMYPYDEAAALRNFEKMETLLSWQRVAQLEGCGFSSELPVFVFGMPRSGTTLVEQILAAHPLVHAAGELELFGDLAESVTSLDAFSVRELGRKYVDALREHSSGAAVRVTDKMPSNFRYAGLINLALPGSRLIHVRRDPLDTCFSCFAQTFPADGLAWTNDLGEIGRYYRAYARLMEHWRTVLPPAAFLEVCYEELVRDFETQARRIVEYCGLPWDERCLEFHKVDRHVKTASAVQVRRPLYDSSIGRSRAYARHLVPLIEALG